MRGQVDVAGTPAGSRGSFVLTRYMATATLARGADGGAGLGLILLALTPGAQLTHPAQVSGVLVAGLSAPHLAGPVLARRLDATADGRRVLAVTFAGYGVALAAGSLLLGRAPVPVVGFCVVAAGLCGPLLTGGLSSRLRGIAGPEPRAQHRAEGWDAVTYGLGGTAGPATVAVLASLATPLVAMLSLCAATLVAAVLARTLPPESRPDEGAPTPLTVRDALSVVVGTGPLRRVTCATTITAVTGGGLSILAVNLGGSLSAWPSAGAVLAATFGIGNLVGSLLVTAWPLRGEPERLATRFVAVMSVAYGLCACAPTYPLALGAFALAGAVNAPFFTATLAARSRYAPPAARAQIFVSVAGLKIAAAAAGAALAGSLLTHGPRTLLVAGAILTLATAATTVVDRHNGHRSGPTTS